MSTEEAYRMSSVQLDIIWKLEQDLQSLLFNVPKRQCLAVPSPTWGKPMCESSFQLFKRSVIRMYIHGATHLLAKETQPYGFGLFKRDNTECVGPMIFSNVKYADLGYLIYAPSLTECPTAHRYLRSPFSVCSYLGGPISLSNHSDKGNLRVSFVGSTDHITTQLYHHLRVYAKRALKPNEELLWDYYDGKPHRLPLHEKSEWFLDACCTEGDNTAPTPASSLPDNVSHASSDDSHSDSGKLARNYKRPKLDIPRPRNLLMRTFSPCSFCGINLDAQLANPQAKTSYQRHLALKHARDIVEDVKGSSLSEITEMEFLLRVHAISMVKNKLKDAGIHVLPACNFFIVNKIDVPDSPTVVEEQTLFRQFQLVSQFEFNVKSTVYLKGLSVPTVFQDLRPSEENTNYDSVIWVGNKRPSVRNFGISHATEEELSDHKQFISESLKEIYYLLQETDSDLI